MKNNYKIYSWGFSILIGSILSIVPTTGFAQSVLYAINNQDPFLHVVNRLTGAEESSVAISLPGEEILNGTGLAVSPISNEMYAAVKLASQVGPGRNLIMIDPETGAAVNIGNMGQPIASLTFDGNGELYGVSGDCLRGCGGEAVAETLFKVNTNDASLTFFQTLGNGNDGEAIAFNPTDGMMYHMSGVGVGLIFEKINLGDGVITPIPLSGDPVGVYETIGFIFDVAQNLFVGSLIDCLCNNEDRSFFKLTSGGFLTHVNTLPFWWKDYAFYSKPTTFDDVPSDYWAFSFVETLAASGITSGCGASIYCPEDSVTRAQMAVFLVRGIHGSGFNPPPATGNTFLDVGANDFAASFIEQFFLDGITGGCGGNNYCPNDAVTRAQMAVFLLRAKYGANYSPPPATGIFADAPLESFAVAWIEQLAVEGITSGCGNGNYCPDNPVTRAQMAVFLVRTFGL